jgi:LPS export ABC transporter protein LptC
MPRRPLLFLVAACALLGACRKAPVAPAPGAAEKPGLLFRGFSARASHGGRTIWEARAVSARVYDQDQRAVASDVAITYFVDGRPVSRGWARSARMDLKDYDLEAEGDVRLEGSNGVKLYTSRLNWDNSLQRADSSARVRVVRGSTVLTGRGFSADRELRDVRILQDVQAEAASLQQLRHDASGLDKGKR